jgi:hypothetical protein
MFAHQQDRPRGGRGGMRIVLEDQLRGPERPYESMTSTPNTMMPCEH